MRIQVPFLGHLARVAAALKDPEEQAQVLDAAIGVANSIQIARTNSFRTSERVYGWFEDVFADGAVIQGAFRPGRLSQQYLSDASQREFVKILRGDLPPRFDDDSPTPTSNRIQGNRHLDRTRGAKRRREKEQKKHTI